MDRFDLIRPKEEPREQGGELASYQAGEIVAAFRPAHDADEALSSAVLLENLTCKASAVHAVRCLLRGSKIDPGTDRIRHRMRRGSGRRSVSARWREPRESDRRAVRPFENASGSDVKAFCAGPIHALIMAGALVACRRVRASARRGRWVPSQTGDEVPGRSRQRVRRSSRTFSRGWRSSVGPGQTAARPCFDWTPSERTGSVPVPPSRRCSRISSESRSTPSVSPSPRSTATRRSCTTPRSQNRPAAATFRGRNYRMLAALGAVRGELGSQDIDTFAFERGLPGYSLTQGHIASAIPWLPHALARFARGELRRTMLFAEGQSLPRPDDTSMGWRVHYSGGLRWDSMPQSNHSTNSSEAATS